LIRQKDQLKASSRNFLGRWFYLRNGDIFPQYLRGCGFVDICHYWEKCSIEKRVRNFHWLTKKLGLSNAKCPLAHSKSVKYNSVKIGR